MRHLSGNPVVHLELHSANLARAANFYTHLLDWRIERVELGPRSYHLLDWGGRPGGGIVECATSHPVWLPYANVPSVEQATDRARRLGAAVVLQPREGPAGWRSVIATPDGGEIAFWQSKRHFG